MTQTSNPSRNTPFSWQSALDDIPPAFRDAAIAYAWKRADSLKESDYESRLPIELKIATEMTGLSPLIHTGYVPFHLIPQIDVPAALTTLENDGPGSLLAMLDDQHPDPKIVLILGDNPSEAHLSASLTAFRDQASPRRFIAGPGVTIEAHLRKYLAANAIGLFFLGYLDASSGKSWDMTPGAALDTNIAILFAQHTPTHLLALEPVRLPACQIILEKARTRNIPIEYVGAPTAV